MRRADGTCEALALTLADRATHETRTVILVAGHPQALHRRPLGLVPPDQSVPALAQVQLTAGGLVVRTPDGGVQTLGHATTFALADGTVTVRYRAHGVTPQAAHPTTKERS